MKISYSWLRDYVDFDLEPLDLADRLTMLGLEVDDVGLVDLSLEGVVVGKVVEVRPHPNADQLVLCDVDLGSGDVSQIVCGAPNVEAGQMVPVALPGTTLYLPSRENPEEKIAVTLKRSKIRGETSNGMICAEDELGISDDHSGIMVLDDDQIEAGSRFSAYLEGAGVETKEAVFDIELTPNRPDATCHVGVAREVAAILEKQLHIPEIKTDLSTARKAGERVTIRIDNPESCGRYVGILVEGVTIAESPDWLKRRLESVGLRPRNNIVDITNYVMYELGQPLHAFDFDTVGEATIVVRNASEGEPFTTLDGIDRSLDSDMLMICDGDRSVAVAGVMGGENSEVTSATTTVLIESAWFDPSSIRKTARRLSLQTDASYRFERGVDPNGTLRAAGRAADLMIELAGGRVVEIVDVHPRPHEPLKVELRPSRVEAILGVKVPENDILSLLTGIGFDIEQKDGVFMCQVPTFRPDVEREIDLVEEVARLYGFDRIPAPSGSVIPYRPISTTPDERLRSDALIYLAGLGFREVYNNSLLAPAAAEVVASLLDPEGEYVETHNAINRHMSALRPSLLPGVLRVAAHNRNHGQKIIRLTEFGHVFHRSKRSDETRPSWIDGYVERESLILALAGPAISGSWDREESLSDLFDLKGMLRSLTSYLRIDGLQLSPVKSLHGSLRNGLDVKLGDEVIGVVGQVAPQVSRAFDLDADLFFAELFWGPLAAAAKLGTPTQFREVSRFPTVSRDLAIVIDEQALVGDIVDTIRVAAGPLLLDVGVFDLYRGEGIGPGQRSIGFTLEFGADRTLVDAEVDEAVDHVVTMLSTDWKAKLRS